MRDWRGRVAVGIAAAGVSAWGAAGVSGCSLVTSFDGFGGGAHDAAADGEGGGEGGSSSGSGSSGGPCPMGGMHCPHGHNGCCAPDEVCTPMGCMPCETEGQTCGPNGCGPCCGGLSCTAAQTCAAICAAVGDGCMPFSQDNCCLGQGYCGDAGTCVACMPAGSNCNRDRECCSGSCSATCDP